MYSIWYNNDLIFFCKKKLETRKVVPAAGCQGVNPHTEPGYTDLTCAPFWNLTNQRLGYDQN